MTWIDIASLIISFLSLIATVAISFVIYNSEKKNSRKSEELKIKEEAKRFIIENAEERDYLHWATIADGCFSQNKHVRKVYNNFSLLSNDVKKEVLKQVGMDIPLIDNSKWINNKIELIRTSIKQLDIGDNDFLYDNAKYFHRLYSYKNESIGKYSIWDEKYDDVFDFNRPFTKKSGKVCFRRYLDDYLFCKYSKPDKFSDKWQKPLNYMNNVINIRNCDEDCVSFWIAEEIINAMFFAEKYLDYVIDEHVYTDAQAETFEDRYFEVLYELFYFDKKD